MGGVLLVGNNYKGNRQVFPQVSDEVTCSGW